MKGFLTLIVMFHLSIMPSLSMSYDELAIEGGLIRLTDASSLTALDDEYEYIFDVPSTESVNMNYAYISLLNVTFGCSWYT